jgi:hypothetical protein
MADDDQPNTDEGAPRGRGGARTRGERVTTDRDVESALARMAPERLAEILASKAAALVGPGTPKFGPVLEAVKAEEADAVIEALSEAMAILDEGDEKARLSRSNAAGIRAEAQKEAIERVDSASAAVALAAQTNSRYRGKPLRHSLEVARARLEHIHGQTAA